MVVVKATRTKIAPARHKTLLSEINSVIRSLLVELSSIEESRVLRAVSGGRSSQHRRSFPSRDQPICSQQLSNSCTFCKAVDIPHNLHWLTGCPFLPQIGKSYPGCWWWREWWRWKKRCARATSEFYLYLDDASWSQSQHAKNMTSSLWDVTILLRCALLLTVDPLLIWSLRTLLENLV